MAEVTFSHPLLAVDLGISVKPDQVTWAYGLNTQSYPTYGGEVVQILSVFFDDMTITGTVSTVAEAERIYGWFITYMQYATQGRNNQRKGAFDQHPVVFKYPARGWQFSIWPKALPGFAYDRDVTTPTWTLVAAVKEPDATFAEQIKNYATFNALHHGQFDIFGLATADFGTTGDLENNPFASPDANPLSKGESVAQFLSKAQKGLGDEYDGFVQAWTDQDLTKLPQFPDISKPPGLTSSNTTKTKPKNKQTKGKSTGNRGQRG